MNNVGGLESDEFEVNNLLARGCKIQLLKQKATPNREETLEYVSVGVADDYNLTLNEYLMIGLNHISIIVFFTILKFSLL
jgi:hypothetical protein